MTNKNTLTNVLILILTIGFLASSGLSLKMNKDLNNQLEANVHVTEQLKISIKEIETLDKKVDKLNKEKSEEQAIVKEKDEKIVEQEKKINSLIEESKKKDSEISGLISKKENDKKQAEMIATEQKVKAEEAEKEKEDVKEEEVIEQKEQNETTQVKANATGKTLTVEATAYSTNQPSMSNLTFTEINLDINPNVIAVDPSFIPLGSTVYIEGYGTFIAGDTGGDIVGNRIDVHMTNLDNAIAFGRKTMEVVVTN